MAAIEIRHLNKKFGHFDAIPDLSFDVKSGDILVIVGASGCGKTTTLRCIAGLEKPTSGEIRILGETVVSGSVFVPPENRGIGMMFQSYALWPHMSVYDNIAYGLDLKRLPSAKIRESVHKMMELMGLSGFDKRFPSDLSGGQQQRVALARSAVTEPKILLLDEPLSNLDAKLRERMRADLRHLVKELRMTAIHITHDQAEAMAIADQIIFMRNGQIEQAGTPRELYNTPANRFVADFIGSANFLAGKLSQRDDANACVQVNADLSFWATLAGAASVSDSVTIAIRPEQVVLSPTRPEGPNVAQGQIIDEMFLGNCAEYRVRVGETVLVSHDRGAYEAGATVYVSVAPQAVICMTSDVDK